MAVAYVRVSTRSQSFATQRASIERAARARGDKIAHWFTEKRGGKSAVHPELDALIASAHRGEIRQVYVFKLDRFSRSMRTLADVIEALSSRGASLVSVGEPWLDLKSPATPMLVAMFGWLAEQELAALGERIASARARVEAQGKHWGRPPRCDASTVAKIRRLSSAGRSQRQIAIAVKVPRATVGAVLAEKGAYGSPAASSQKRRNGRADPPAAE